MLTFTLTVKQNKKRNRSFYTSIAELEQFNCEFDLKGQKIANSRAICNHKFINKVQIKILLAQNLEMQNFNSIMKKRRRKICIKSFSRSFSFFFCSRMFQTTTGRHYSFHSTSQRVRRRLGTDASYV